MVTHTWGFVKTRPGSPWTKVEVRAERGAILRVSGTSYAAVLASLARIRSAFQGAHVRWPGKALTLHFHPACHASELAQLDLPIALSLLAIQGHVSASSLSRIVSWGMVGLDGEIKAETHRLRVAPAGASQQHVPNNIVRALGPDPATASRALPMHSDRCNVHAHPWADPQHPIRTRVPSLWHTRRMPSGNSIGRTWRERAKRSHGYASRPKPACPSS